MNDSLDPNFPRSPWSQPAASEDTRHWRDRCAPAISHVAEAILNEHSNSNDIIVGTRTAINIMLDEIFEDQQLFDEKSDIEPSERRALIAWLGRASAVTSQTGDRTFKAQSSIGYIESDMLLRWTLAAWRCEPLVAPEPWALGWVEFIDNVASHGTGLYHTWGAIPNDWTMDDDRPITNAQIDLFTFLQAFEQQKLRQQKNQEADRPASPLLSDDPSRTAMICFSALRSLASSSEMVDDRILTGVKKMENLYSSECMDKEHLRLAGSAEDHKALRRVVEQDISERPHARGRKL
jgi:hypothetical protein